MVISLVFGAIAGVIALIVARLFADPRDNKSEFVKGFGVLFAVLLGVSQIYAKPWYEMRKAEAQLQEISAFKALKRYDPSTYTQLIDSIKDAARSGSKQQVFATAQAEMMKLVQKRVPSASDEAVVGYMTATMNSLHEVYEQGGDACHHFLFPTSGEALDPQKYFSKQAQDAMLDSLAKVIETSARDPQPVPTEFEVKPRLEPILRQMASDYGNDLLMLQNPNGPLTNKRKVCTMAVNLYDMILALPEDESGKVLRYMVSKT